MLLILRGGELYAPDSLGIRDVILAGEKIIAVLPPGQSRFTGIPVEELDMTGKLLAPGLIDSHVHILGGGGEGGPSSRAPELRLRDAVRSGVTSMIGCLGTDSITRHLASLLAKAHGLTQEGLTTLIFTGSYQIPVPTLTGSVKSDLVLVEKVVGAGEVALSDHRSSQPTFDEFARLAAECRVGGMLGGKAGVLHCHLGDGPRRLEFLFRLLEETEIPAVQVIPTHINRNPELFGEGITFLQRGGFIDVTAGLDPDPPENGHLSVARAVQLCLQRGAPLNRVTVSSDGNGSMPVFDAAGQLTGLTIATQESLITNLRYLIAHRITDIPGALGLFTVNPAQAYRLAGKGGIREGMDADLIAFDREWNLTDVIARGRIMMADGRLKLRGTFDSESDGGPRP